MKKLIILAVILALMVMATAVLAAPGANSPWVWYDKNGDGLLPDFCDHSSGADGAWYENLNSGKTHCFKS